MGWESGRGLELIDQAFSVERSKCFLLGLGQCNWEKVAGGGWGKVVLLRTQKSGFRKGYCFLVIQLECGINVHLWKFLRHLGKQPKRRGLKRGENISLSLWLAAFWENYFCFILGRALATMAKSFSCPRAGFWGRWSDQWMLLFSLLHGKSGDMSIQFPSASTVLSIVLSAVWTGRKVKGNFVPMVLSALVILRFFPLSITPVGVAFECSKSHSFYLAFIS